VRRGVYPGSFDPLTVAHIAIAEAARAAATLDRIDLALSRRALGKDDGAHTSIETRTRAIEDAAVARPWLGVIVTEAQLIVDIARGYDAVVMGADKWAQVRDPEWYGDDVIARDAALASLPRVLVAPRPGFDTDGAQALDIGAEFADVSSTRARSGAHHLRATRGPRWIVDGNNVIGSRPDGWWRDRPGAARRLVRTLQSWATRTGTRVAIVLDGRPLPDLPEGVHGGILVAYASRAGRNAADDRIVAEVERDRDPGSLVVVTSDRILADRVRALGARVEGASTITRALESGPP